MTHIICKGEKFMKNIEIVRGYRSFGHENVFQSNPNVTIVEGDVIDPEGNKVTLKGDKTYKICGIAIERNLANGEPKPSGKIPVYISNFVVRTSRYKPSTYEVNDPVTIEDGIPAKADPENDGIWGYVIAVNTDDTIDILCNY